MDVKQADASAPKVVDADTYINNFIKASVLPSAFGIGMWRAVWLIPYFYIQQAFVGVLNSLTLTDCKERDYSTFVAGFSGFTGSAVILASLCCFGYMYANDRWGDGAKAKQAAVSKQAAAPKPVANASEDSSCLLYGLASIGGCIVMSIGAILPLAYSIYLMAAPSNALGGMPCLSELALVNTTSGNSSALLPVAHDVDLAPESGLQTYQVTTLLYLAFYAMYLSVDKILQAFTRSGTRRELWQTMHHLEREGKLEQAIHAIPSPGKIAKIYAKIIDQKQHLFTLAFILAANRQGWPAMLVALLPTVFMMMIGGILMCCPISSSFYAPGAHMLYKIGKMDKDDYIGAVKTQGCLYAGCGVTPLIVLVLLLVIFVRYQIDLLSLEDKGAAFLFNAFVLMVLALTKMSLSCSENSGQNQRTALDEIQQLLDGIEYANEHLVSVPKKDPGLEMQTTENPLRK